MYLHGGKSYDRDSPEVNSEVALREPAGGDLLTGIVSELDYLVRNHVRV